MYDDRVEIENPGRLPLALTPETIKSAHASYPYNPLIAEVLFKSSFLESWGSGVKRMVDACRAQGVPEPEYVENGGFVMIVFRRPVKENGIDDSEKDNQNSALNGPVNGLSGSLKEVYLIVLNNPGIKIKQVADLRHKSESTVKKQLATLKKMNLIEYRDSDKTGWILYQGITTVYDTELLSLSALFFHY